MLLALSWQQGLLTVGLPLGVKRYVLAPILSNGFLRSMFGFLSQPVIATVLFSTALYFWEIPKFHNLALVNEPIHYVMRATMLLAGLIFW